MTPKPRQTPQFIKAHRHAKRIGKLKNKRLAVKRWCALMRELLAVDPEAK